MKGRQTANLIKKTLTLTVLVIFAFLSFTLFSSAATAPLNIITYQGRLLDSTGAEVVAASASMSFAFYDAVSGGTCLWSNNSATCASIVARTVTLTNALFTENLGDTTDSTPYAAINDTVFANNASVYLEVIVNGETLTPRKRITAAAYALNAQTLDGLNSTALHLFEVGTNGTYEDDAATIIGSDSVFTYGSGAVGDLKISDELEVIGNTYLGGNTDAYGYILARKDLDVSLQDGQTSSFYSDGSGTVDIINIGQQTIIPNADALNINLIQSNGATAGEENIGINMTLSGQDSDGDISGIYINAQAETNAAAGTYKAGIRIDNWEETVGSMPDAILIYADILGNITDAVDASESTIVNALNIGPNTILGTNGVIDFTEFDVNGGTGSVTIDDGGNLGQLSVEGTILDINSLDFVGAGAVSSASNNNLEITANGNGQIIMNIDADSPLVLNSDIDSNIDLTTGSNEHLVIQPNGTGDSIFQLDNDTSTLFNLSGNTGLLSYLNITYPTATTLNAGASTNGLTIDLSTNITVDAGGNNQTGLIVSTTNGGAGGTTKGVEFTGSPDFDIELSNNEYIKNSTDSEIQLGGAGGATNASLIFDFDGSGTVPTLRSGATDTIDIYDGVLIGVDGTETHAISDVGFSIVGGNDLYVADKLGINGDAFFDNKVVITAGAADNLSLVKTFSDGIAENGFFADFTPSDTGSTTSQQYGFYLDQNSSSLQSLDAMMVLDNSNSAQTINTGILFAPVDDSSFTTGIAVTGANTGLLVDTNSNDVAFNGALTSLDFDQNFTTTGPVNDLGNNLLITRDIVMNSGGQTLTVTGDMLSMANNGTQTAGTLTEIASMIYLDQNYAAGSGSIIKIDNASVGEGIKINQAGNGTGLSINSDSTTAGVVDITTQLTAGTIFGISYDNTKTLTNDLTGIRMNLSGNVIEIPTADINGIDLDLPGISTGSTGTTAITGLSVVGSSLTLNPGGSEVYWVGNLIGMPDMAENAGTVDAAGIHIDTSGTVSGDATEIGLAVHAIGIGAGTLKGVDIQSITAGAGTEVGLNIGNGWDDAINVNSDAFIVETTGATDLETSLTIDAPATASTQRLCASSGGGDALALNDVMIVDCSNAGQADFAEMYPIAPDATYGDIVVPGTNNVITEKGETIVQMIKSTSAYQNVFGGIVVNNYEDGTSAGYNISDSDNPMPISLVGRVPVHVTNEGGLISVGDPITTSSTAGYGMKASEPGMIIGYALNNFSEASGEVMVFIHSGWYAGNVLTTDGSATLMSDTFVMNSLSTADSATPGIASQIFALRGSGWDGSKAIDLDMKIQTQVTDASEYRLSVKNTTGTEVAYISNEGTMMLAGDLIVTGKFYPSDRGTAQTSKYIYYDGSIGPGGDMMRTNAAGWSTGSYDFAEMFSSTDVLEAGDVVVFSQNEESVGRSNETYSQKIAGIVSTRPGFLAGENKAGQFPIALAGRVPTKVNLEGGTIAIGDPLTTSSTAGYAMKASEAGQIVGYALEPYSGSGNGKIIVFVNAGYFDGTATTSIPGVSNTASLLATGASANFTTLNLEGDIYMGGNDILNIGRLVGLADLWSIEEDGTIKTQGTLKTVITSYQNEKVEASALTSTSGVFVTLVGTTELQNGLGLVTFEDIDPYFNDVISNTAPIRVIVTPSGPVSLYVSDKNQNGFTIQQIGGNDSGIQVDWMVTAYRKDYEPQEEDELMVTEEQPTETITETPEIVVETPAVEETEPEPVIETTEPVIEETIEPVAEVPAESPIEISDPTVESDGGIEPEPPSTDSVSTDSSTQMGG